MMSKQFPYYFEVKCYDGESYFEEGGFSYASDWDEAARDIKDTYGDELCSMKIEMYDHYEFAFPIATARKIKEAMQL